MKQIWKLGIVLLVFVSGCTQIPTGAFLDTGDECFAMWDCVVWSDCNLIDGRWIQTRSCTDAYDCGDNTGKPKELQDCQPPLALETKVEEISSQCGIDVKVDSVTISKDILYRNSDGDMTPLSLLFNETFVVPYIEITNNFKYSVRGSFLDFVLEDQDGTTYQARCPSETVDDFEACQQGDNWHFGSKFIPIGEKREGNLIFFVPDTASEIKLFYTIPLNRYDCKTTERIMWKLK